MSDQTTIEDNRSTYSEHRIRGRGRRAFWSIVLVGVAVAVVSYMTGCVGQPRHHYGAFSHYDSKKLHERADWLVAQTEATDEQRQKVVTILKDLDATVVQWQQERETLRDKFIQALQAERVNPDDLWTIKSASVTLTEQTLSRTVDAALQMSEVLTAQQRKELVMKWRSIQ